MYVLIHLILSAVVASLGTSSHAIQIYTDIYGVHQVLIYVCYSSTRKRHVQPEYSCTRVYCYCCCMCTAAAAVHGTAATAAVCKIVGMIYSIISYV